MGQWTDGGALREKGIDPGTKSTTKNNEIPAGQRTAEKDHQMDCSMISSIGKGKGRTVSTPPPRSAFFLLPPPFANVTICCSTVAKWL